MTDGRHHAVRRFRSVAGVGDVSDLAPFQQPETLLEVRQMISAARFSRTSRKPCRMNRFSMQQMGVFVDWLMPHMAPAFSRGTDSSRRSGLNGSSSIATRFPGIASFQPCRSTARPTGLPTDSLTKAASLTMRPISPLLAVPFTRANRFGSPDSSISIFKAVNPVTFFASEYFTRNQSLALNQTAPGIPAALQCARNRSFSLPKRHDVRHLHQRSLRQALAPPPPRPLHLPPS